MTVVTRFAPSPTGYLHIGGARTALFCWLYARRTGGKFLIRIEDTDHKRSTKAAIDAIHDGLDWLGLKADAPPVLQSTRAGRHAEVVAEMLVRGTAFRCYVPAADLDARRAEGQAALARARDKEAAPEVQEAARADAARLLAAYRSPYRDGAPPPAPDAPFVVRLRAPDDGEVVNEDLVQGRVAIKAGDIDDLVLLRADGTPTYMLAVVVDDHDMGVTHVIRGDDHLTNAARQIPIFQAAGWPVPLFAHVPMIHGDDGAKLSKRHGALAVQAYREMGYLPEALLSYLMHLGWSHGDREMMTLGEAAAVFDVADINKSPSRLDLKKLDAVNAHFVRLADDARLAGLLRQAAAEAGNTIPARVDMQLESVVAALKGRAATIPQLLAQITFLTQERPLKLDEAVRKPLKADAMPLLVRLHRSMATVEDWSADALSAHLKAFAEAEGVGFGQIGPAMRAMLTAGAPAPDLGVTLALLGREESLARMKDVLG
jgi:glutamyl-tRNA synthetase